MALRSTRACGLTADEEARDAGKFARVVGERAEHPDDHVLEDAVLHTSTEVYDNGAAVGRVGDVNMGPGDQAVEFPAREPDGLGNVGAGDPHCVDCDGDEGALFSVS